MVVYSQVESLLYVVFKYRVLMLFMSTSRQNSRLHLYGSKLESVGNTGRDISMAIQ